MSAPSPIRIFDTLFAYQQSAALKAGIELDLFTAIAEGATTAAAIAEKRAVSERGVRILCDTLVTYSLLEKTGGHYANTQDSALFLTRSSPAYMGSIGEFLFVPELIENTLHHLPASVRKGGTVMEGEGTVNPDNPMWVTFARAMAPMTRVP